MYVYNYAFSTKTCSFKSMSKCCVNIGGNNYYHLLPNGLKLLVCVTYFRCFFCNTVLEFTHSLFFIYSLCGWSYDRSVASSKLNFPQRAL